MEEKEIQWVTRIDQRGQSAESRIERLERRQDETDRLLAAMNSLRTEQNYIKQDVAEIKGDVKSLTMKPGKRWEAVVEQVVLCVLSAVIAMLMARIS